MREMALKAHLRAILGEEGFIRLCQEFGGTRVYVPKKPAPGSELVNVLGQDLAVKLSRAMAPDTIRVPLARRERALHYREIGLSDAKIARLLGITENGVGKLFARETNLPDRAGQSKTSAQLDLF